MPMHDWVAVEPTIFHHFHQHWAAALSDALNTGVLPPGFSALIERSEGLEPPDCAIDPFAQRANRVAIRHRMGDVVCIIEIVSPGNKASRSGVRQFVEKTKEFLRAGVNVLLVDPFPPTPRDPGSLHNLVWDETDDTSFEMPADEPLLLASYRVGDDLAGVLPVAFLETFRVGGVMPDMPAWLDLDSHVPVPLERTYRAAWEVCPADYRYLVEHGRLPEE